MSGNAKSIQPSKAAIPYLSRVRRFITPAYMDPLRVIKNEFRVHGSIGILWDRARQHLDHERFDRKSSDVYPPIKLLIVRREPITAQQNYPLWKKNCDN